MHMLPAPVTRRRPPSALVASAAVWLALAAVPALCLAAMPPDPAARLAEANPPAGGARPPAELAPPAGESLRPAGEASRGNGGAEGAGGIAHEESPWALVARIFNFALLAGTLVYLLRSPLTGYLAQRGIQVRSELTRAAAMRKEAAARREQVEAKMRALPDEIEALKRRGAEEIAAEEARIGRLAEAERRRLLDQARRDIDMQLRIAERDLRRRVGELAVEVATSRVKRVVTGADHARLVDQYVAQLRQ